MGWLRLAVALLAAGFGGCASIVNVPTSPNNYRIEPGAVSVLRAPQSVTLKNAYPAEDNATFQAQADILVVEQKQLTETAVVMLSRALAERGIATTDQAGKTIVLAVRAQGYLLQPFRWTGKVVLEARLGDGSVISYPNQSRSLKGWEQAFDGAVLFALNNLLVDARFISYMNR